MSEQDVDKIFRDNLKHTEEPISDADWKQFEALAGSNKSFKWVYFLSGLLLLVTAGYFTASTLLSTNESVATTTTQDLENESAKQNAKENYHTNTSNSVASIEASEIDNENQSNKKKELKSQITTETSDINKKVTNTRNDNLSISSTKSSTEGFGSAKGNDTTNDSDMDTNNSSGSNGLGSESSPPVSGPNKSESTSSLTDAPVLIAAGNITLAPSQTQQNAYAHDPAQTSSRAYSEESHLNASMEFAPEEMDEIGFSEIETAFELADLNEDAPNSEMPTASKFSFDVFGQFELNNELGGIPSLGLMGNWNQNKWKISVGISLAKTGTLNWNQEREDVIYGFDKYSTASTLRTKNFTYISAPVQLSRFIGRRSGVFIGLTPAMIVNAAQAYNTSENGISESSGYLFDTGAPDFILFLSGGYQFHIHEDFRLDLGINYSPQKWEVTSKNPVGGFLRLNYNIR